MRPVSNDRLTANFDESSRDMMHLTSTLNGIIYSLRQQLEVENWTNEALIRDQRALKEELAMADKYRFDCTPSI